jgi:hypothetical protein
MGIQPPPPTVNTGIVIRLYGIVSPHNFRVSIKKGETAYPLTTGYVTYNGIYSGGTSQIEITGRTFNFNTQYWVKLTDVVTGRYIIENVYIHDKIAYSECNCTAPVILSLKCYTDDLDCELSLSAIYVSGPPVTPSNTPTSTPPPTPTPGITPTPSHTPTIYNLTYNWEKDCNINAGCAPTHGNIKVNGTTIYSWINTAANGFITDTIPFTAGSTITITATVNTPSASACMVLGNGTATVSVGISDESYFGSASAPPTNNTISYTYTLTQDTIIDIMSSCS